MENPSQTNNNAQTLETKSQSPCEKLNGEIDGAKFTLAIPKNWNKKLLIHCHGCVPEGIPLTSDVKVHDYCYNKLLNDGWIVK